MQKSHSKDQPLSPLSSSSGNKPLQALAALSPFTSTTNDDDNNSSERTNKYSLHQEQPRPLPSDTDRSNDEHDIEQGGSHPVVRSGRQDELELVDDGMVETNWPEKCKAFDDMNLDDRLLRGIFYSGFQHPSLIQQRSIIPITKGYDVIGQAQSGTGKTGAFTIGALQSIDDKSRHVQLIIVEPVRELAQQTAAVVTELSKHLNIRCETAIGGVPMRNNVANLSRGGVQVIVATPGRLNHLMRNKCFDASTVRLLILDEADELLEMNFQDQIYELFQELPSDVQVCLFSATMGQSLWDMSQKFMRDPVVIKLTPEKMTLDGIKQYYVNVGEREHKFATLMDLYSRLTIQQAMIFCTSKRSVEWLADQMTQEDFNVSWIHAGLDFTERAEILAAFRRGETRVLLSTDVLARGIDVRHVSLVINFELPRENANYLHRVGRSGRFGRKGVAINLVTDDDTYQVRSIERNYCTQWEHLPDDIEGILDV